MNSNDRFENFVTKVLPVLIILLSLVGDILGLVVFSVKKNKLNKLGPINMYIYLFIFGIVNVNTIFQLYLHDFGIYLETMSDLSCQLAAFYWTVTAPISPMILVYISFERFISIKYPDKKFILNKNIYQYVYMIILVVFNVSINSWVPFDFGLVDKRNTTNKFITNYNTNENFECVSKSFKGPLLWTVYGKIIPYSLMITFTILLISSIFKSRNRVITNYTNIQNETFKRDVKFAFTSLSINVIFILLNLPASIIFLFAKSYPILYLMFLYLYLFSFSINFYLLFIFNSLFRDEFLSFFSKCKNKNVVRSRKFKITKSHYFLIETYV